LLQSTTQAQPSIAPEVFNSKEEPKKIEPKAPEKPVVNPEIEK